MTSCFLAGAYYSRLVSEIPRIRAIVLNNNLYYKPNNATEGQADPGGQLVWLNQKLRRLEADGEKVSDH